MPDPTRDPLGRSFGRGRSAEVFLTETDAGAVATKVFVGDRLSNLVHRLLSGADNPYRWSEDAIRGAYHRRQVLSALAGFWFDGRLVVAEALSTGFDEERRAFRLATTFLPGQPAPLIHPLRPEIPRTRALQREIMRPLTAHLREAGLDGMVWQAGYGNPVAFDNFLLLDDGRFALIDAESGVPALFPANPWRLLTFYLPRSLHHGRPLFDDTDVPKLRRYLDAHEEALRGALGDALDALHRHVDALDRHQRAFRRLSRKQRREQARRIEEDLTDEALAEHRRHRWRDRWRAIGHASHAWLIGLAGVLPASWARVRAFDRWGWWRALWAFLLSQDNRTGVAKAHIHGRIDAWQARGQLSDADADAMRDEVRLAEESSTYLTDFGTHLGLKASLMVMEVTVISGLIAAGWMGPALLAAVVVMDGALYRTAYTMWRGVRAALRRHPLPWVALAVGVLPLVGSLAFPAQMIWSAQERRSAVARFVILDGVTALGRKIPIWGGEDTLTEHLFNRLGAWVAGVRASDPVRARPAPPSLRDDEAPVA